MLITRLKSGARYFEGPLYIMFDQPPLLAFQGVQGKLEYDQLEIRRFIKKHGLHDFKLNIWGQSKNSNP